MKTRSLTGHINKPVQGYLFFWEHVTLRGAVFFSKPPGRQRIDSPMDENREYVGGPCGCLTSAQSAFLEPPPHILIPLVPSALLLFTSLSILCNFVSLYFCRKHWWDRRKAYAKFSQYSAYHWDCNICQWHSTSIETSSSKKLSIKYFPH